MLKLDHAIIWAAANLLQAEEHLLLSLNENTNAEDVSALVAEIRKTRSQLMIQIFNEMNVEHPQGSQLWCAVKHLLSAMYRLLEAAERASPQTAVEQMNRCKNIYDIMLALMLSHKRENQENRITLEATR